MTGAFRYPRAWPLGCCINVKSCSPEYPLQRRYSMSIMTPERIGTAIWRHLLSCSLLVLAAASIVTLRVAYLEIRPNDNSSQLIEMACWRVGLLLVFQSAPLLWARFIYKGYKQNLICIPLYQTTALLRMPLAIWAAGCLLTAAVFWPVLHV